MQFYYIQNCRFPTEKAHGYQIIKTCDALVKAGAGLTLVVADRKNHLKEDAFAYYGVSPSFKILKAPVMDLINAVPSLLKPIAFYIEQYTFLRSIKKMRFGKEAVIYTRDAWLAPRLKSFSGLKTFLELHAMPSQKTLEQCKNLDGILCLTKWMQNEVGKIIKNARTAWLPDAVDIDVFNLKETKEQAREFLNIKADARVVVYGGRFTTMENSKGLAMLDDSVSKLAEQDLAKLYLVGGTKEDFINTEGREPSARTTCVPNQSRERLALYYKAADVLAMPFPNTKHYAYEMSPLKMFEYMASGTAIVTSDLPSVREVLDEGMAYFYKADDENSFSEVLKSVLRNPEDAAMRGRQANEAAQDFSWYNRAKAILNFIEPHE